LCVLVNTEYVYISAYACIYVHAHVAYMLVCMGQCMWAIHPTSNVSLSCWLCMTP